MPYVRVAATVPTFSLGIYSFQQDGCAQGCAARIRAEWELLSPYGPAPGKPVWMGICALQTVLHLVQTSSCTRASAIHCGPRPES